MDNYVYHDRKMMKWMPFNALLEQSDYLRELLYGKTKKAPPILSTDQEEELNYQLETAYLFKSLVTVSYYHDGELYEVGGVVTKTDQFTKTIFINNTEIPAKLIVKITLN